MKNIKFKLLIDILAFIAFLGLVSSGILMHYLLPVGSGRWLTILGMNRHEWGNIHFYIATGFFSILALHLVLHWRFIVSLFKNPAGVIMPWRVAYGISGLIAILVLVLIPLLVPVKEYTDTQTGASQPDAGTGHGQRLHR